VPVAVNLYKMHKGKGPDAEFFRALQKQRYEYQGFWIATPEGKLLSVHHQPKNEKTWVQEARAAIRAGLEAFGPLPPPRKVERRDPLPFRGRGVRPDGSVTLAAYVRLIYRGQLHPDWGALDTIAFSAKEWEGFAPPEPARGKGWTVPEAVVRKFSRCLECNTDQSFMPRPEEVYDAELIGNVHSVKEGVARLTYTGEVAALHKHPFRKGKVSRSRARVRGEAIYDVKGKRLLALALYFEGTCYERVSPDRDPYRYVAGVEWRLNPAPAKK
jgi:hypothetical protein